MKSEGRSGRREELDKSGLEVDLVNTHYMLI